jgi:hypothetical protein
LDFSLAENGLGKVLPALLAGGLVILRECRKRKEHAARQTRGV